MRPRLLALTALALYLTAVTSAVLDAGQAGATTPRTVWYGVFTSEQASRGQGQFSAHCAECHQADLSGGEGPALVGERFWNSWRESTVDALFDFVRQNMPHSEDGTKEGTLPARTYLDLVAHILNSNGFPAGQAELTAASAGSVQIIRREGPGPLPATTLAHVVGCLARGGDGSWRLTRATNPMRVRAGAPSTQTADKEASLGTREIPLKFVLTSLTKYVGYRVAATGALIGEGGVEGLNVDTVTPVSPTCE